MIMPVEIIMIFKTIMDFILTHPQEYLFLSIFFNALFHIPLTLSSITLVPLYLNLNLKEVVLNLNVVKNFKHEFPYSPKFLLIFKQMLVDSILKTALSDPFHRIVEVVLYIFQKFCYVLHIIQLIILAYT